jgi:hypothetical protein
MSPEMTLAMVRALLAGAGEKAVDPDDPSGGMDTVRELQRVVEQAARLIDEAPGLSERKAEEAVIHLFYDIACQSLSPTGMEHLLAALRQICQARRMSQDFMALKPWPRR